ncbi:hypothetical protein MBGDN05_00376 [Thermoplasmatales archaeon SCGC AB-539-N05]|nr:hypothetical protein MBGDN05_00376 [Thermoplasmatales archaeon SCGC AB-539-N05]
MYDNRKNVFFIVLFLFGMVFLSSQSVFAASPINFKLDFSSTFGMAFIAVTITAIAIIITFFALHAGVKYVTPENVLEKEIRKTLYNFIGGYPGSHLREIARDLKLKPSNASWHLRKLEQTDLVRSRRLGGKRVYYLVEGGIESRRMALAEAILRNKNARDIMHYLQDNPGKHLLEISRALDLNHHTVKWHLQKMNLADLVEDHSTNSHPQYFPTDIGVNALETFTDYLRRPGRGA